jgi:hypothetical protein
MVPDNANVDYPYSFEDRPALKKIYEIAKERFGIELQLEAVLPSEFATVVNSRLAAGQDMPDIIKCESIGTGVDAIRQEIIGDLAAEVLFGESSELYLRLYEQGIIDSSFSGGFETVDGCALLTCGGDSYEAETVLSAILDCARRLLEIGIPDGDLLRMKRSALGRRIRDLDSFDSTCFRLCAYKMADFDYFCFPAVYTEVTAQQVLAFIEKVVKKERCALSIIEPRKQS